MKLWYEGVFVVFYIGAGGFIKDNRNNIEAIRAVVDIIGCEKIAGGADQPGFLGGCDRVFGGSKIGVGFCSYLDEDNRAIGVDHDEVKLACLAGKVAGEGFQAFSLEELFASFFTPSAEVFAVGQQFAFFQQHPVSRELRPVILRRCGCCGDERGGRPFRCVCEGNRALPALFFRF